MECKRDYGTTILIVNQDKIIKDYNIFRKPNYSFHIYDNNQLEFREMEYIENDLINQNDQFTIDVERSKWLLLRIYFCGTGYFK